MGSKKMLDSRAQSIVYIKKTVIPFFWNGLSLTHTDTQIYSLYGFSSETITDTLQYIDTTF